MRKLILTALCLLTGLIAFAQYEKFDELTQHLAQGGRINMAFSVGHEGNQNAIAEGNLTLQGACYCAVASGMKIIGNGKTQWTIDDAGQEIYIEQGGQLSSLLSNPKAIRKSLSSISSTNNSISGIFTTGKNGSTRLSFHLKDIRYSEASDNPGEFSVDCSEYPEPWVITDLR